MGGKGGRGLYGERKVRERNRGKEERRREKLSAGTYIL